MSHSTETFSPQSAQTPKNATNERTENIHIDLKRKDRCGFPEAIFGEGKTLDQLTQIAKIQLGSGEPVFVTRIADSDAQSLSQQFAGRHNPVARTLWIPAPESNLSDSSRSAAATVDESTQGYVPVLAAGTTDLPVAEEAIETLHWMNIGTRKIMDVGVAGPHRLIERLPELENADAIIVVAGMEGALPSVVAGHVDCPVIAVPTSVGYGANLGGISALLSMLNSCAANISVVNIDAGFKGAYVAGLIASRVHKKENLK